MMGQKMDQTMEVTEYELNQKGPSSPSKQQYHMRRISLLKR